MGLRSKYVVTRRTADRWSERSVCEAFSMPSLELVVTPFDWTNESERSYERLPKPWNAVAHDIRRHEHSMKTGRFSGSLRRPSSASTEARMRALTIQNNVARARSTGAAVVAEPFNRQIRKTSVH